MRSDSPVTGTPPAHPADTGHPVLYNLPAATVSFLRWNISPGQISTGPAAVPSARTTGVRVYIWILYIFV